MKRDDLIFELIEKEHQRQLKGIELIASENFVSDQVMQAMGSCLTNKYAEGYPGKRYYGGCEVVDQSEQIAIDRLKQIFGAEWANVQPHSGAQANAAVFLAVLNPGDKFMGLNLAHGGHLSHGSLVNTSGIIYTPCEYNLNQETGRVDYDQMEEVALREKPKMIIGGGSAYSREWDYKRMREIADKIGAILMIDMAHPAGLIAAGELDNPVKYAHIVTSTTHKTLRGPRGGVIMMGKDFPNPWGKKTPKGEIKMMSQLLDSAVFPGIQGGPLEHVIAAKAVAFGEILQPEWKEYAKQVKKNAATLAQALIDRGFTIVSGGTDKNQTYFSAASVNSDGIIPNNEYDRYNFTFRNTSYFLKDKLRLDASASYIYQKDQNMTNQGVYSNPLVPAYLFPRGENFDLYRRFERYNEGTKLMEQFWSADMEGGDLRMQNPYWINYRNLRENNKDRYMLTGTIRADGSSKFASNNRWGFFPGVSVGWNVTEEDQKAIMAATTWNAADNGYFRGGGFSSRFETRATMPATMIRLNLVKGLGPVLQIAEGWTVALPEEVSDKLWKRTDYTWPCTWFAPRCDGKEGPFKTAYDVMNNWGANHGAISYGHIGADLITMCSMLRIPVSMHNVPEKDIYRPAAWNAFGMEKEGADFRACKNYGPLYK